MDQQNTRTTNNPINKLLENNKYLNGNRKSLLYRETVNDVNKKEI